MGGWVSEREREERARATCTHTPARAFFSLAPPLAQRRPCVPHPHLLTRSLASHTTLRSHTHVPLSPLRRYACRNHPAGQVPFFCMGFQKRLQTDDQVYAKVRVTDRVYQNACKPSCVCVCVCV